MAGHTFGPSLFGAEASTSLESKANLVYTGFSQSYMEKSWREGEKGSGEGSRNRRLTNNNYIVTVWVKTETWDEFRTGEVRAEVL